MEEAGRCDDPNAVQQWNIFKLEIESTDKTRNVVNDV